MCCILIQCAYAYACEQARNEKPTLQKINQNCDFFKKILTILTAAMSKIRGNSLILARLTMPLKGNICIQRGAFFVKSLFFAQTLYPYVLAGIHHMLDHIKFDC